MCMRYLLTLKWKILENDNMWYKIGCWRRCVNVSMVWFGLVWYTAGLLIRCSIHPNIIYATGIAIIHSTKKKNSVFFEPKQNQKKKIKRNDLNFKCSNCFKSKKFAHFTN